MSNHVRDVETEINIHIKTLKLMEIAQAVCMPGGTAATKAKPRDSNVLDIIESELLSI